MRFIGLVFVVFGLGLLAVVRQSLKSGTVPAGSSFFRPFRPSRDESPLAFYAFVVLYTASGIALSIWGLLIVAGFVEAPPLT